MDEDEEMENSPAQLSAEAGDDLAAAGGARASHDHAMVNAVAAVAMAAELALHALREADQTKSDAALSLLLRAADDVARLKNPPA